ncbi:beta-lactamase regulating signal transducer with metallopeptidase domain [Sphingopyxis panaciterrae]|uniref:M56 family metallopeptidase n=1 Tax=Sphingopyxis panaciterrae TaxID=363841 RepID=UPI00142061FA|nr:M56 family metallopeptidase [Sphingopyxis panaciterrae]NIJ36074.1 beta-lactamase regulating signal transducer with metallopeptidase domain [Sphingopyxis panaciterrae]
MAGPITAAALIGLAWKSVLVAGLTLALLRLVGSRSAGERSLVAHAGLAALLALPVATLLLPQWQPLPARWSIEETAPAPSADAAKAMGGSAADPVSAAAPVPVAAEKAGSPPVTWRALADLAPWIYALPLALLAGLMGIAVVRLFAMRGRADVLVESSWLSALAEAQRRMGFKHGTALLVSDELRSPISWGVLRPTIVLSPKAVAAVGEAEAIIAHELAHVARLDWAKLLAARLACAVFWFNPLVWMLARESHQLREEAADDAVLMADIDGPDYATLLVGAARHDNKATLIAAHGVAPARGSLKRRITRVLDGSLKRGPASASWILMSLVVLAGITAPLAAFSATAKPAAAKDVHASAAAAAATTVAATQPAAAVPGAAGTANGPAPAAAVPDGGLPDGALSTEQLVGMRAAGVTPDDVRRMRDSTGRVDVEDVIAAKASGVDAAYVGQMRGVFPDADVGELVGARAVGIDAPYAREMRSLFPRVELDELVSMRALGVDGKYVREMRRAGYPLTTTDDAIEMRAVGYARPPRSPSPPRPPRASGMMEARGADGSMARIGPGGAMEARSADGRVARIGMPETPETSED